MRSFVAFVFVALATALMSVAAGSAQVQFGGKGVGGGFGTPLDAEKVFDLLAKGADTIIIANQPVSMRQLMEQFAGANKINNGLLNRQQFAAFFQQILQPGGAPGLKADPGLAQKNQMLDKTDGDADEQTLRAAGLSSDADSLQEFFRERMQPKVELDKLLALARQLGDADAKTRAKATGTLLARGSLAIPALRQVANALDNPLAAQQARHCLEWLDGKRGTELSMAAAKVLAARQPVGATKTLLDFLPLADDETVVAAVKAALDTLAARPGPADPALLFALKDDLPLRRAVAVEVLAASRHSEVLPKVRELLADPKPQVRLRAALALTQRLDEKGVGVLIELLVELPAADCIKAELALHELAGEWSPNPPVSGDDDLARKIRREVWAGWWRSIDGPALLAEFCRRSLTKAEQVQVEALIAQLGDPLSAKRERATAELTALGPKVVNLLTEAARSSNLEQSRRAQKCLKQIALNEEKQKLPTAAPRLLAVRKPGGACEALLNYLPFSDDGKIKEEVAKALKSLAVVDGKLDPTILAALSDPSDVRRKAAAEALASNEAVPALIKVIAELPREQALKADELLRIWAGAKAPPLPSGKDLAEMKKLSDAWQAVWKSAPASFDLPEWRTATNPTPTFPGLIVIAELGPKGSKVFKDLPKAAGKKGGGKGVGGFGGVKPVPPPFPIVSGSPGDGTDRLLAVDRKGNLHWQIDKLSYPVDFRLLPSERVLIAEFNANRVTERDFKGNILWQVTDLPGSPVNVQRMANGNTFIAIRSTAGKMDLLMEVDRAGKRVFSLEVKPLLNAGYKLPDGQFVFLVDGTNGVCVRLDASGKEVGRSTFGGDGSIGAIEVTAQGHLVVAGTLRVHEYDTKGRLISKSDAAGNRVSRLPNGNNLVASENSKSAFELNQGGETVWKYESPIGYLTLRARQSGDTVLTPQPALAVPPAPPKADYGGIDPNVVAAWERAGAEFGWITPGTASFAAARPANSTADPGFRFPNLPPKGGIAALPPPAVPFGLNFANPPVAKAKGNGEMLTGARMKELAGFKQLHTLDLKYNDVTDLDLKALAGLKQLQTLLIGGNPITDAGLKELAGLKQLQTLGLGNTNVTDAGLKDLTGLKLLQQLTLTGAPVTPAGVAELQKALPGVNITATGIKGG